MAQMSNIDIVTFADDQKLASAVAGQWLQELGANLPFSGTPYSVALSGGRIARRLFESITSQVKALNISLKTVHFFWGDERCVPPNHPESNYAIANELLLAPLKISTNHIHRVPGEQTPKIAAGQAESELRRVVIEASTGQPVIDLIFLGMGEDGHVASLFPVETEVIMADKRAYRPVIATKPPPERVTLGYQAIAAARQVWVLASGAGKEQALRQSLSTEGSTPLARVLKLRRNTKIFTDIVV